MDFLTAFMVPLIAVLGLVVMSLYRVAATAACVRVVIPIWLAHLFEA